MKISGILDDATLDRALKVHFAGLRIAGIALIVISAVRLAIAPGAMLVPVIGGIVGVAFLTFPAAVHRSLRRAGVQPTEAVASESGIRFLNENTIIESSWSSFHQAKVLPDLVILYRSSADYHILSPGLFATTEEWGTFLSWIRSSVPRPHRSVTFPRGT